MSDLNELAKKLEGDLNQLIDGLKNAEFKQIELKLDQPGSKSNPRIIRVSYEDRLSVSIEDISDHSEK